MGRRQEVTNEKGMDSGLAHIQSANAGMTGNDFVEPHIRWRGEGRHETSPYGECG